MVNRTENSIVAVVLGAMLLTACQTWPTSKKAAGTSEVEPYAIYSHNSQERRLRYTASGYMGDGGLAMSGAYIPPHEGTGPSLRVSYSAVGNMGWAGVYWQQPANNWGDMPGNTGYDLRGAQRLRFWARGEKGGEKIHEVRVGGIVGRNPDSDVATEGPIVLSKEWKRYEIDLEGKDLRHIIAGFGFFVNKFDNPNGAVFYLDDIAFELPKGKTPSAPNTPEVVISTPVAPSTPTVQGIQFKTDAMGLRATFSSQLLFDSGKSSLRPESRNALNQLVNTLKAYPGNDVLIEGHTDSTGAASYNLELSRLRASHVRDYLIKEGGFNEKRFRIVGYGDTRPIASNKTASGRTLNRRVDVIILKSTE